MNKRLVLFGILCTALVLSACSGPASESKSGQGEKEKNEFTIAGGPQGGGWYGLAGQLASEMNEIMTDADFAVLPGGGIGNITLTQNGEADIATTASHLYKAAVEGKDPYDDGTDYDQLTALANIGTSDSCMFIVREDIPFDSIQDLVDAEYPIKLVTTLQSSTPYLGAIRILEEYGVSLETLESWGGSLQYLDYSDGCQLIADGHADGIIAPEVPSIVELATSTPMKILPLDESVVDSLVEQYGYGKNFVEAGTYSYYEGEFWSIGEPNILLCRKDLPDEVAYQVCKLICEKPDVIRSWGATHANFDPDHAHEDIGGDLHPGAAKFFTERGNLS